MIVVLHLLGTAHLVVLDLHRRIWASVPSDEHAHRRVGARDLSYCTLEVRRLVEDLSRRRPYEMLSRVLDLGPRVDTEGVERWSVGTGPSEIFHGTPAENVRRILAQGLRRSDRRVWASSTFEGAARYIKKTGLKSVVVKVRVPKNEAKIFQRQEIEEWDPQRVDWFSKRDIPPEWIVDVLDPKGKSVKKKYALADDGGVTNDDEFVTIFVVVTDDSPEPPVVRSA